MSRKYTKSNFADFLETIVPELYRNEDIQLSGLKVDPVLDLINRHVQAADDGVLSISSIPDDATTFRLDNVSGLSQYFVKQNELTNVSPFILESKVLLPLSASLADFSTSSDFNAYLSATLLPQIVPPTASNVGTLEDNITTLSSLVDSTDASAVHAHLVDTLGWMYFLNTSADGDLDYAPSAYVLDSLTKVFNGTTLTTVDGVKGLNKYLWENLEVCSFSPYVNSDFETLDALQTMTDVVYSPSYFDKDDTKVKEAFDDYMDSGSAQTDTVSAGPMRKLLAAMGFSFADISSEIEEIGLIYDIENVREEHLQYIAQLIGFRLRGNSSDKWRHQLRIAVDLYKKSGTLAAIQGAINALISETVFDVSGQVQELWECYLPHLIWYALGTESPMFKDLTTWTAEAARLAEVDTYSTSSLEDNLKLTTDAILLDLYKTYPDNFLFFGDKLPVPRMVELDKEGCEGDVYTIINEPTMKEFFVVRPEDSGFQFRERDAIANGEEKAWKLTKGPLGEGVYFKGSGFSTDGTRPEYLSFQGDLEFVFSFRGRTNWPMPPFEEVKYYRDSSVTADLVKKLVERLKCFQVRPSFADWLGSFITDAAVTDSTNLGTLNEWLMFFDEPQQAENFDSVMLSTSDYQRNLLDLFSGKSSHLFIDFDGADFDFAKTTLEGDGRFALYEAARVAKEFSPAHAITRVNLNATALDEYTDPLDTYWDFLKLDYDDTLVGYASGSVLSNFDNRGVSLDFLAGGGDASLGSDAGRGGLNTFKREYVDSIYDAAMASETVLESFPSTETATTPANYIVANDLANNTSSETEQIALNKRANRAARPGNHVGGSFDMATIASYFGSKEELVPASINTTQVVIDRQTENGKDFNDWGITQIVFSNTGIEYTLKDQASWDQWTTWTPQIDIKWEGRDNSEWEGTNQEDILWYEGNPQGDKTPLTNIISQDNTNFVIKYGMTDIWPEAGTLQQLVDAFNIVNSRTDEKITYLSRPYGYIESCWRQGPSTEPGEGHPDNSFYQLCWITNGNRRGWASNSGEDFPAEWTAVGVRTQPNSLFGGNGVDVIVENTNLWGGSQRSSNVFNVPFNDPATGDSDPNLQYTRSGKLIWNNVGCYGTDPSDNLVTGLKWGSREYALNDREVYDCDFARINKEHGIYTAMNGDCLLEGSTFSDIAAQGCQISYRSSPFKNYTVGDNAPRDRETLWKVKDCHFSNCGDGTYDGGARRAFTITFFSPGSSQFPGTVVVEDCSIYEDYKQPANDGGATVGSRSSKTCVATRAQGTSYDVYGIPSIFVDVTGNLPSSAGYRELAQTDNGDVHFWNGSGWVNWGQVTGNIMRLFRWSNNLVHKRKLGGTTSISIRGADEIVFDHSCFIYDAGEESWPNKDYKINIDSNPSDNLTTDSDDATERMASKLLRVSNCKGIGRNGGRIRFLVHRTIDPGTPNERDDFVWDFELTETDNVGKTKIINLEALATTGTLQEQRAYNYANENLFVTERDYDVALDGEYPSAELGSGGGGSPPDPSNDPPGQVQGLTPSNGSTDVSINTDCSWQTVSNAESYDVYFETGTSIGELATPTNTTSAFFDPGTLLNGTQYTWRVDSVNSNGTTTGDPATFTTEAAAPDPPGAPTNLLPAPDATGVSINQTLTWEAGANTTNYDVFFGDNSTPGVVSQGQTSTVYNPGQLDYDQQYWWRVNSRGPGGVAGAPLQTFTTEAAPPPPEDPPGSVTQGTPNNLTDVRVDTFLGWIDAVDATGYSVFLDASPTPITPTTQVGSDVTGTIFQPASDLDPGTTYYWKADAGNQFGVTTGAVFNFTTLPLPGEVLDGGPNSVVGVSRNSILNWEAVSDAEEYLVYFGTTDTPPNVVTTTSTNYDPGTLQYNTTYFWNVTARNSSGDTPMTQNFSFTTEEQDLGGGELEGGDFDRRALRRRNYKYLLPKEGYYDRTGHNAPVTWEVSSMENFGDGMSEQPLGFVASAGKFHPVVDPIVPSGVWDACEGLTSPRSFSGLDTSNAFPYRGLSEMGATGQHVDRDQLPGIYSTMHELLELKARDYADQIIAANPGAYSADSYWKNQTQSLANSAIEDGYVLASREEYDNFKFGLGLHKLFADYNEWFGTHGLAPHIWDQTGGNVFAHVFGKGLFNCDFSVKGDNWLRADGQSFFASSVDSGVSVNAESIWNDSSYDLVTENNLIRVGRFVGLNGWLNFQGIQVVEGALGPDNSTAATTLIIEEPIGSSEANQRTETTFDLPSDKGLEQPFTFNIFFKKILHPEGESMSQLRYQVSLGSNATTFEEDLDLRYNTFTGALDSSSVTTDGPGYTVSDAVPTANDWFRATVMLKDYAGTAAEGRVVISPAPFEANSSLTQPLVAQVWNAECQKGEGFTNVFYGAGTTIADRPVQCVVPLSGTYVQDAPFNAEFRNSTILSGIDLVDISGAPTENEFKIFRLDPSKKITGESNFLVDNTFVKAKSIGGLPRLRFDLGKIGVERNYFVPEHKFRLDVSALIGDERSSNLGGGQLGVWIHTVPRQGYFWSYTGDGKWTPMKTEDISINNVISWSHIHTFENREIVGTGPACLNTLIQAASGTPDVNFNTIEESFFETVSFEFDTRNFTTQNNSEYLQVIPRTEEFNQKTPVVHDTRNNYVVEIYMVPQTNEDKYMIIDNIGLTDLTLREGASIGTGHGVETKGIPLRRFVNENRLYLDKGQLADVLKFYNGMVGIAAGEYTTNLASRDKTKTEAIHETDGGSRLNYRTSPSWNTHTKQAGFNNYENVEFDN